MHTLLTFDTVDPVFWVAVAFVMFIALLMYFGVPAIITKALDARADAIRMQLDEARRLREEAQALLASYQSRAREAEDEAKSIVDAAKRDAAALAADARRTLDDQLARRTKVAEEKIARAEQQAVNEVRGSAVEAAIAAAERLLATRVSGAAGNTLIETSISELKGTLN